MDVPQLQEIENEQPRERRVGPLPPGVTLLTPTLFSCLSVCSSAATSSEVLKTKMVLANSQRRKVGWWWPRTGRRGNEKVFNGYRVSVLQDEKSSGDDGR